MVLTSLTHDLFEPTKAYLENKKEYPTQVKTKGEREREREKRQKKTLKLAILVVLDELLNCLYAIAEFGVLFVSLCHGFHLSWDCFRTLSWSDS